MSWIGINPYPPSFASRKARPNMAFDPTDPNDKCPDQDSLLVRGTVMFEAEIPATTEDQLLLLAFRSDAGWRRRFSIVFDKAGSLQLTVVQGDATSAALLSSSEFVAGARVRISYSWDAPARIAHMTVQSLDRFSIHQAIIANPLPLPLADLRQIVSIGPATRVAEGIICLAIADHVAPVGLNSGLMRGNLVATTEGYRSVERLALGDMVETAHGGPAPIRWITRIEMPAVGHFAPVRLRAPYYGLSQDIVVAQCQGLLMNGPDAEYLFGADTVLVRAHDLTNLQSARYEPDLPVVTYYQILLDRHDCLDVGGTWAESLYIGQLGALPGMTSTTSLGDLPAATLPRHSESVARVLRSYEAASLLSEMTA